MVKKFDVKFKCIADGINFSKSIGNNMGCGENLLLLTIIETKRSCFEMATKMRIIAYIDFTNVVFKHYFLLLPVPNQLHGCML
ncbi:Uncharacterised protein [Enterobacter hormaechei]|nr:hypothetical protein ECDEC14B_0696 [Escherichia coli DEC14B]KJO24808.1 hypothetical protein SS06_20890 [Enterobacter roggenkampii]KSX45532.1 hypothetical protein APT85_00210 [Klebsiella pneumoniae]QVQ60091.1 hypothetical protein [Enterobacter cloacae complex sp.]UUC08350.1 hypothetical protein [Citrobacter freundii]CZV72615.1 Uncharacterised protein [Enterobacter hormaechei]